MEPPASLTAKPLRDEKVKVFQALRPLDPAARGARPVRGLPRRAGRAAGLADRDLRRGAGRDRQLALGRRAVPPALGQIHGASRQVVTLGFQSRRCRCSRVAPPDMPAGRRNELVIDFADPGSITHRVPGQGARPGDEPGQREDGVQLLGLVHPANALEGYERLILDAMLGDQSLFTRSDGIERLWEISAPLLENPPPVEPYARGSWGPTRSTS